MTTLLAFAAMIMLVVAVHEWGHYLAARYFGVRVLRFSVGFGSPLLKKTDTNGTEWVLAPIPLGGYVRLLDKHTAESMPDANTQQTMEAQSNWARFVIYAAGPMANIVLAFIVLTGVLMAGESGLLARIGKVEINSPAMQAGLAGGDDIMRINGQKTMLWRQALPAMANAVVSGQAMKIETDSGVYTIPAGTLLPAAVEEEFLKAVGTYPDVSYLTPVITAVAPDSAAAAAGIVPGDTIVAVNDTVVEDWQDLVDVVKGRAGMPTPIILWRDSVAITVMATLATAQIGRQVIGRLGVSPSVSLEKMNALLVTVQLGPFAALAQAAKRTSRDAIGTFAFLGRILSGDLSLQKNVSGPVGIAVGAGAAANAGFIAWWGFVALISISLAVFNLLPLPLLDGGQMVICIVQSIIRRPLPDKIIGIIDRLGIALLLCMMGGIIFLDLAKL
ncbi:RIP metalloprotease RseP [Candidatus Persebacteraceae bacterium Df01]|uniref:Zinc metalloprotease n=1 Tax=Candidatus Doriopsillibacter californiensis TaxID=2970740 RepID=A0ABT7QMU4_9GAMM|nr:RIP metalloprotease RseP [Candidatus Persebacteraceae bacterium Df01]